MFDFNKLDSYKESLDDGFCLIRNTYTTREVLVPVRIGLMRLELPLTMRKSYVLHVTVEEKEDCIKAECWEDFKTKVADYFLGGEE